MNPYDILGISPQATDDEVKRAYRTQCKKYHPDLHVGKPDAAEAEKKFLQVQQAYEQIMKQRQGGGAYEPYGQGAYGGAYDPFGAYGGAGANAGGPQNARMQAAANFINVGHYREALNVLDSIPDRTGQWYFFSAVAHWGMDERMTALEHARTACRMEPGNLQYRQTLSQMENGGAFYSQYGEQYGRPGAGMGSICMNAMLCPLCYGGWCCMPYVPCVPCC